MWALYLLFINRMNRKYKFPNFQIYREEGISAKYILTYFCLNNFYTVML